MEHSDSPMSSTWKLGAYEVAQLSDTQIWQTLCPSQAFIGVHKRKLKRRRSNTDRKKAGIDVHVLRSRKYGWHWPFEIFISWHSIAQNVDQSNVILHLHRSLSPRLGRLSQLGKAGRESSHVKMLEFSSTRICGSNLISIRAKLSRHLAQTHKEARGMKKRGTRWNSPSTPYLRSPRLEDRGEVTKLVADRRQSSMNLAILGGREIRNS